MKSTGKFIRSALAAVAVVVAGSASATTLTNSLGSFANWAGIDWKSNGTAVVTGFDATSSTTSTFDLVYWASAANLVNGAGETDTNMLAANIGILSGTYEYTIRVLLNETSNCLTFSAICQTAEFTVNSGTLEVWYDTTKDANQVSGAGITDGTLLFSGIVLAQAGGGFDVLSGGNATLQSVIDYTNPAFISPDLTDATATSTLQIGGNQTGWVTPTGVAGDAGASDALPANSLKFQADANLDVYGEVPEPGTLAMAGLALAGLGFAGRRRARK